MFFWVLLEITGLFWKQSIRASVVNTNVALLNRRFHLNSVRESRNFTKSPKLTTVEAPGISRKFQFLYRIFFLKFCKEPHWINSLENYPSRKTKEARDAAKLARGMGKFRWSFSHFLCANFALASGILPTQVTGAQTTGWIKRSDLCWFCLLTSVFQRFQSNFVARHFFQSKRLVETGDGNEDYQWPKPYNDMGTCTIGVHDYPISTRIQYSLFHWLKIETLQLGQDKCLPFWSNCKNSNISCRHWNFLYTSTYLN